MLEGLRGESTIAELCRKEGIHSNLYYKWSKEFLEAGIETCSSHSCNNTSAPGFPVFRRRRLRRLSRSIPEGG